MGVDGGEQKEKQTGTASKKRDVHGLSETPTTNLFFHPAWAFLRAV